MVQQLDTLPTWILSIGGVLVVVAVSLLGMALVRRSVSLNTLESHNEVAGFIIAIVGVIYAVLIAFVVIIVWESFDGAEILARKEAVALNSLFLDSRMFEEPAAGQLRQGLRAYAQSVISDEWPAMAHGKASPKTEDALDALWPIYKAVEPRTPGAIAFYAESVRRLNEIADTRQHRLFASHGSLPGVLWVGLLVGGAITVAFSYFFGMKNVGAQVLMTAALAGMIGVMLMMILTLDSPFSGDIKVGPEAMQHVLDRFARS